MARNTGDFTSAAGMTPPAAPATPISSNVDESGILKPIAPNAPVKRQARERTAEDYLRPDAYQRRSAARQGISLDSSAASTSTPKPASGPKEPKEMSLAQGLKTFEGFTGKKAVGMNDTIRIVDHLGAQLLQAHLSLSANGKHPKHDEVTAGLRAAASSIAFAKQKKDAETPLAWEHISAAGKALHAVHKDLHSVDASSVADISASHSINGVDTTFTPGKELLHITKQPSEFRTKGRAPKRVGFGSRVVDVPRGAGAEIAATQEAGKAGIRGAARPLRRDVIKAFEEKTAPVTRRRKSERDGGDARSGMSAPMSLGPVVDKLGAAAGQPNKVGDWSGTEQAPTTGVPQESKAQARVAGKRVARAKRRATQRAKKAGEM